MKQPIQSQYENKECEIPYWEINFTILRPNPIDAKDYRDIEKIIETHLNYLDELNKIKQSLK